MMSRWVLRGRLPAWAGWLLVVASVMTVIATYVGSSLIVRFGADAWWRKAEDVGTLAAFGVVFALVMCWLPHPKLTRAIRVAILLPFVQVAVAAGIASLWVITQHPPRSGSLTPYLDALSPGLVLASASLATIAAGAVIGTRRQRVTATVTFALVHLLLFGLWMPLATSLYVTHSLDAHAIETSHQHLRFSVPVVALVMIPPFVGACAVSALAFRRPAWFRRARDGFVIALALGMLTVTGVRLKITYTDALMFANFTHVALALAMVATLALVALGISLWLRVRRGRHMLARSPRIGTIVDDGGGPIASLRITGWLRSAELVGRPFEVLTNAGPIAVPAGVEVVIQPPHETTQLAAGDSVVVLEPGTRIALAGFIETDESTPYRGSAGIVPSNAGAWIAPVGAQIEAFETVALTMWRPCIAYLLVAAAVMLPALAGVLGV